MNTHIIVKKVSSSLLLICGLIGVSCTSVTSNSTVVESQPYPIVTLQHTPTTQISATNTAVSPHLSTPTLLPTHTLIPTKTSTPQASATAKVLLLTPNPNEPECPHPPDLKETEVDISGVPFCIVWVDKFDDESGFHIVLQYDRSGEHFVYVVGPDMTQLVVPEADAPRLNESLEQCLQRKDWQITVIALRSGSEYPFGGMAATVECGSANRDVLPTATPIMTQTP